MHIILKNNVNIINTDSMRRINYFQRANFNYISIFISQVINLIRIYFSVWIPWLLNSLKYKKFY